MTPNESGWRTVCEPYNVVLMSVLFAVVDVELVGSETEVEGDKVVLDVVVVVAPNNCSDVIEGKLLLVGSVEVEVFCDTSMLLVLFTGSGSTVTVTCTAGEEILKVAVVIAVSETPLPIRIPVPIVELVPVIVALPNPASCLRIRRLGTS